ncbi:ferrous iron transport protein B [Thermonema lapsum]|uniref:Ferrous iron transport protein B n=1 Tax=Thermonema lapsum TaxID=28195 RepID=A0A846MQD7_9BACT|nr:ferrous iron transport protein B [Thermonema lapsum]NIK73773.1 ferrous iron transport protein B [Thermonema lapsum]
MKDAHRMSNEQKVGVKRRIRKVALLGNPNSGKTTLFNALTGLNQKVGNFPGVTVDKKIGICRLTAGNQLEVLDLPGIYSLYPKSLDEQVVLEVLLNPEGKDYPDAVVVVADAANLKRHLLLCTQLIDLGLPILLVLNMVDVAEKEGISIDTEQLQQLLGIEVVATNARKGVGIEQLKEKLTEIKPSCRSFYDVAPLIDQYFEASLKENLPKGLSAYAQWLCLHLFERLSFLTEAQKDSIQRAILHAKEPFKALNLQREEVLQRYEQIDAILAETVLKQTKGGNYSRLTRLLDRWLLHPLAGYATFLLVLLLIFQSVFTWASVPMDWIDASFSEFVNWVHLQGGDSLWVSFVADGLLAGLGGILVFVPQIAILFFLLGILEETGYMARVAVLMDKVMRQFGLNGRSVVPLVSGVACAIPAIMAARTIPNPKERLITMMVVPLMSCSARLPVYTVLVALAVPNTLLWGWLSLQGVVMLGLYLLGTLMSLLVAWLLNRFLRMEQGRSFFMLEMPLYRLPRWRNLLLTVWEKARTFVVEAGKVILLISVLIWGLASFGPGNAMEEAERELRRQLQGKATDEQIENAVASVRLEQSYAGYLGRFIEPAIRPLGYDWKIGIALISSFAAREVFVGTISTIYSIGSEDEMTVVERLRSEINPHTGKPVFNLATSVSLLLFYAFAMQCMSTMAVMYRETHGWKYPLWQLLYMSAIAYLSAWAAYQWLS